MTEQVRSKPVEIKDYGNGHVVRYYMLDGAMRVEETCNGRVLDTGLLEFMTGDLFDRMRYFGLDDHQSSFASGPTNRGSP